MKFRNKPILSIFIPLFLISLLGHPGTLVEGANILFFFGVSTYSHRLLVWPLAERLSQRGHNITFFSPYLPSKPNPQIHEFSPTDLQEFFKDAFGSRSDFLKVRMNNGHQAAWHQMLPVFASTVCDIILKSEQSLAWLNSSSFDLVIIDALFNDCGLGLAWKFGAPHILFGTTSMFMWQNDAGGFPLETSWIPAVSMDYKMEMSFFERVSNTVRPVLWHLYRQYVMHPKLERSFREVFQIQEMPSISEIERNVSLVLQNLHYSLDYPRSMPPLVVEVGGLHIEEDGTPNPLPKDMQQFLDQSKEGFIYVSFGSVVQMSKMPVEMRQMFTSSFGNSSMNVLWKYELEGDEKLPGNIFASKWMPQQEILKHPNIKGFITHGGILSIEEAVFNEVPLIVLPVFADQDFNAENVNRRGLGLKLSFADVNQTSLLQSIKELVTVSKYKDNVKEVSNIFKDRPQKPLQEAVWWVEYVLRNPASAKYLRPYGVNQTWFQRRLLDVWTFVGFMVLGIMTFFIALSLSILNCLYQTFFNKEPVEGEIALNTTKQSPVSKTFVQSVNNNNSPVQGVRTQVDKKRN